MTRVSVIGNAGGGKSTMCEKLGKAKGLPVFTLDQLQWNRGWVPTPSHIFKQKHDEILANEKWIIDGFASWETIEDRFKKSDTIIFIDHPVWVHYWWAIKRQFMCIFRTRQNFPSGCPMLPMTSQLFKMIWYIHKEIRPKLIFLLQEHKNRGRLIIHIKSPKELNEFVYEHTL